MKKRIDLILNAKGGVGKSFFAINLVQYLKDQKVPHLAIDTDNANSTLKRTHPETLFVNLNNRRGLDAVFTSLDDQPLVVVDGRAASTDQFLTYFDAVELAGLLKKLNVSLTIIIPVCHEMDSVAQVKLLSDVLGSVCDYVIVKNEGLSEDFDLYNGSQARKRVTGELKGREMVMPELYDWLVAKLNIESLTITQAIQSDKFIIIDRQRLISWQRRFNEQLQSVKELLLVCATPPPNLPWITPFWNGSGSITSATTIPYWQIWKSWKSISITVTPTVPLRNNRPLTPNFGIPWSSMNASSENWVNMRGM